MNKFLRTDNLYLYFLLRVGAVMLLSILVLVGVQYLTMEQYYTEKYRDELIGIVSQVQESIDHRLSAYRIAADYYAESFNNHSFEQIEADYQEMLVKDELSQYAYILFLNEEGIVTRMHPNADLLVGLNLINLLPSASLQADERYIANDMLSGDPVIYFSRKVMGGWLLVVYAATSDHWMPRALYANNMYELRLISAQEDVVYDSIGDYLPWRKIPSESILYLTEEQDISVTEFRDKNGSQLLLETHNEQLDWKIQLKIPKTAMEPFQTQIVIQTLLLSTALIALLSWMIYWLSSNIIQPIRYYSHHFEQLTHDNDEAFVPPGEQFLEFKQLNKAFLTMQKEAREKERELTEFNYFASHDLQEPLRTISSYMTILEEELGDKLSQENHLFFRHVTDAANRMQDLIKALLAYAKTGSAMHPEVIQISEILDQVEQTLQAAMIEAGAKINRKDLPAIRADRIMTSQLLMNLVGNALKYRKTDELCVIRVYIKGSCLIVEDNGIGISSEYFGEIFKPFKRLYPAHQYSGTGIGLAMVKKIVDMNGWNINVESKEQVFTRFIIDLKGAIIHERAKGDRNPTDRRQQS